MSSDSERDIRDRLGGALAAITPSSPPVVTVIRQGTGLRVRRRVGVAAGLAAVIGLGAVLPGIIRHATQAPVAPSYSVTVNPNGKTAPGGVIGSGTINGRPWRVRLMMSDGSLYATGPGLPFFGVGSGSFGGPATLDAGSSGALTAAFGGVASDVTDLALHLANGTVLNVRPVTWHGDRWAAVVVPTRLRIVAVVAYSRHGELAHAVPFGDSVITWLRPGQRGLARATIKVDSGLAGGQPWSVVAYIGPWGLCLRGGPGGDCVPGLFSLVSKNQVIHDMECGPFHGTTFYLAAAAQPVRSLRLKMSGGSVTAVHPVVVGGSRSFAFTVGHGQRFVSWTAYGASGQRLGAGQGWGCGS
jgi:hypothetical protein